MHLNFSEESASASLDIGGVDFDSISDIDNDPAILSFTIHDIDIKNVDDNKVGITNSQQDIDHTTQEVGDIEV